MAAKQKATVIKSNSVPKTKPNNGNTMPKVYKGGKKK